MFRCHCRLDVAAYADPKCDRSLPDFRDCPAGSSGREPARYEVAAERAADNALLAMDRRQRVYFLRFLVRASTRVRLKLARFRGHFPLGGEGSTNGQKTPLETALGI
jgi:hypothetical protein